MVYGVFQESCRCAKKTNNQEGCLLCCTSDEGRPLGITDWAEMPNHLKLPSLKALVVSVNGKGRSTPIRYERLRRTKVNHLRSVDNCNRCQNQGLDNTLGQVRRVPSFWPDGIRHRGGVTIVQALVRNLGICRFDVKGEIQVVTLREFEYQSEVQRRSHG